MPVNQLNLVEVAKRTTPNGSSIVDIAELLMKTNAPLDDIQWIEGNNVTTHVSSQRTTLPSVDFTGINKGVTSDISTVRQTEEHAVMLGKESVVDTRLAKLHPDPVAFRASEDDAFVQAFGLKAFGQIFVGDRLTDPYQLLGLRNRDEYKLATPTNRGLTVTDAGGVSGDTAVLRDCFIIEHGTDAFHGWYPRGSTAGLKMEDMGRQRVSDGAGGYYYAWVTNFGWDFGINIRDPRCVQRVVNVKITDFTSSGTKIEQALIQAINKMPKRGEGNVAIYVPREMFDLIEIRAMDKSNAMYGSAEIFGRRVSTFRGIPIRMAESLTMTAGYVTVS